MNINSTLFARYNQETDGSIVNLLNQLTNVDREKDRGSWYKSLSGLARHLGGTTIFFCGIFKTAVTNTTAIKALAPLDAIKFPEGALTGAQWEQVARDMAIVDKALVDFCAALSDADFNAPVKWFTNDPATVPLSFMMNLWAAHNTHHRGQISQILDEMQVEHNFSGINAAFR